MNSGLNVSPSKNRLRALVNFDEWFPDRLSGCNIALSLFSYSLVVRFLIVTQQCHSISRRTIFSLFCTTVIMIMRSERNSTVCCFKYCIVCHIYNFWRDPKLCRCTQGAAQFLPHEYDFNVYAKHLKMLSSLCHDPQNIWMISYV